MLAVYNLVFRWVAHQQLHYILIDQYIPKIKHAMERGKNKKKTIIHIYAHDELANK